MMVSLAAFAQLAAVCAPTVHVETLAAIARTESGFHAGAINDNTARSSYFPKTLQEAVALALELVTLRKHAVDLGLMQISSANLSALGLSPADVLDPCTNLQAGARVLSAGYHPPRGGDVQPALLQALSRYNTGSPTRGFENGYVNKVMTSATQVIPAIRVRGSRAGEGDAAAGPSPRAAPVPPPAWDVFGQARHARSAPDRAQTTGASFIPQVRQIGTARVPVQLRPRGLPPLTWDAPE